MSNTRKTMKRTRRLLFGALVAWSFSIMVPAVRGGGPESADWPGFRGVRAGGVADGDSLPVKWDVASGEHVKWKTPIPGLAHSSPIIWGERIFVTTAVSADPNPYLRVGLYGESPKHEEKVEHQFRVYCVSKKTGAILWEQTAHRGIPKAQRHAPQGRERKSQQIENVRDGGIPHRIRKALLLSKEFWNRLYAQPGLSLFRYLVEVVEAQP